MITRVTLQSSQIKRCVHPGVPPTPDQVEQIWVTKDGFALKRLLMRVNLSAGQCRCGIIGLVAKKARTPIPEDVSAEVKFLSAGVCCICHDPGRPTQIHHLNEDPSDHSLENLAVLCLDHHTEAGTTRPFVQDLDAKSIRLYREDWHQTVRERRDAGLPMIASDRAGTTTAERSDKQAIVTPSRAEAADRVIDAIPAMRAWILKKGNDYRHAIPYDIRYPAMSYSRVCGPDVERAYKKLSAVLDERHAYVTTYQSEARRVGDGREPPVTTNWVLAQREEHERERDRFRERLRQAVNQLHDEAIRVRSAA